MNLMLLQTHTSASKQVEQERYMDLNRSGNSKAYYKGTKLGYYRENSDAKYDTGTLHGNWEPQWQKSGISEVRQGYFRSTRYRDTTMVLQKNRIKAMPIARVAQRLIFHRCDVANRGKLMQ